jgi:DNA polymerase-1
VKTYKYRIAGDECTIYFPTEPDDLDAFLNWIPNRDVAVDTETTGLDFWSRLFKLRLAQFGTETEAWVLRADQFPAEIKAGLLRAPSLLMHNVPFDGIVLDGAGMMSLDDVLAKTTDTYILAHLMDPRAIEDGGLGHHLKDLAVEHIDPTVQDPQRALLARFKELGLDKDTGWANIPVDDPIYVTYAGLDVLLTSRLHGKIGPLVTTMGLDRLSTFEHRVQGVTARMVKRGIRVDPEYTRWLVTKLTDEKAEWDAVALTFGVKKVNSTAQVSKALIAMGEDLTQETPTGKLKVDADILLRLADLDRDLKPIESREPNPLATAVFHAKRASKWRTSYADAILRERDANDRIHCDLRALQARTARMSISRPPLQQLPSGDGLIRRAFIADPGMTMGGIDYKNIEMRVLAALANEPTMKKAIAAGVDLHDNAALLMYGAGFTKGQRKLAKITGFGRVYGGGAAVLQRQTGASAEAVKHAIEMYDRTYPAIKRYSYSLQRIAGEDYTVTSPIGRPLPVDDGRLYAATNYVVQSTARDILAQALIELEDAGFGENMLLPVHDEVLFQAPVADAAEVMAAMGAAMEAELVGVKIETEGKLYGSSWGHGYGIKDEVAPRTVARSDAGPDADAESIPREETPTYTGTPTAARTSDVSSAGVGSRGITSVLWRASEGKALSR